MKPFCALLAQSYTVNLGRCSQQLGGGSPHSLAGAGTAGTVALRPHSGRSRVPGANLLWHVRAGMPPQLAAELPTTLVCRDLASPSGHHPNELGSPRSIARDGDGLVRERGVRNVLAPSETIAQRTQKKSARRGCYDCLYNTSGGGQPRTRSAGRPHPRRRRYSRWLIKPFQIPLTGGVNRHPHTPPRTHTLSYALRTLSHPPLPQINAHNPPLSYTAVQVPPRRLRLGRGQGPLRGVRAPAHGQPLESFPTSEEARAPADGHPRGRKPLRGDPGAARQCVLRATGARLRSYACGRDAPADDRRLAIANNSLQVVDEVFDKAAAGTMGIDRVGQVVVMIHSGSRGLGHQVATDALTEMERAMARDGISTNDRQLACARIHSQEGQDYLVRCCAARCCQSLAILFSRQLSRSCQPSLLASFARNRRRWHAQRTTPG